ncbi:MAG: FecR domain-containing protein [Gammaproteobacteria bacterium]|nr:FecR domain-containing protein [Gammaproteobacteria bacterium]
MGNKTTWATLALLGWAISLHAQVSAGCEPWSAKVVSIQGPVQARRAATEQWLAVNLNDLYCSGDSLRVGEHGRAAVVLANQTLLRLDQNSALTLTAVKADSPSLLEVLTGWVHFISRVPHSLNINTPFVNAAIEGTEFVVAVTPSDARVIVFEGKVLAQNSAGEVRVTHNETALAKNGEAPLKILVAKPRDAVQWALYYPPLLSADDPLAPIADLLYRGRVNEARTALAQLPANADKGKAKALEAIIAVVNNDNNAALALANEAVALTPNSAATHIALSYAQQARFDLEAALASAQQATTVEPHNALAFARLAELQLSVGYLSHALTSAQHATQLDNKQARAQTILGFAYLTQIHINAAKHAFDQAIVLDQADPLPHLGLGLAKIRENNLAEGRREIEIATMLDPNNALIRSYLGKAYFEEKRAPLDADQFAMAKELDPNDPTAWFYDAIRKQTENRPVEALEDLQQSIKLNDNRAVYRSRLQLDQDEAARSASLARVYSELGYNQLALLESYKSVAMDPSNYSAHRFLADSYANVQRHEIARISELLQTQLLQPVNANSIQPQLTEKGLSTVENVGSVYSSSNEFNSLFTSNRVGLQINGIYGGNNTKGNDLIISGVQNSTSYSFGEYHYATDGFRVNNDIHHNIQDFFVQNDIDTSLSIQAEHHTRNTQSGDLLLQFDPNIYDSTLRNNIDADNDRIGMHYTPAPTHDIIFSYIKSSDNENKYHYAIVRDALGVGLDALGEVFSNIDSKSKTSELQYLYHPNKFKLISGAGYIDTKRTDTTTTQATALPPSPPVVVYYDQATLNLDTEHSNAYTYITYQVSQQFLINTGLAYDNFKQIAQHKSQLSPKFGLMYWFSEDTLLRMATLKTLKRPLFTNQTLEPTQVAGFNQFFDDVDATEATLSGIAFEHSFTPQAHAGIESSLRSLRVPTLITTTNTVAYNDRDELNQHAYLYWTINNNYVFTSDYFYEKFTGQTPVPDALVTYRVPFGLTAHYSNNISSKFVVSYVNQTLNILNNIQNDNFWLADFSFSYRLPRRTGIITVGGKNIFNRYFKYYNLEFTGEPRNPLFQPGQFWYCQVSLLL